MALRLHIDRGEQPITCILSSFPVRIGRGLEVECRLEVPYVSRIHASIDRVDGRLLLQDEGSRTGTWIHDRSRRLQRGARVDLATVHNEFHIGSDVHIRVEYEADEPTVQVPSPAIVAPVQGSVPSQVERTAFAVLQELAASYVPYAPALSSAEAVADFAARLDTVLSVLIEGIASIRYAVEREAGAPAPTRPIRKDLGACLLDWTNDGAYVNRLRDEIRFILGHHRLLVDEVLDRLARMLEYLSPAAIESDPACKPAWWKSPSRARWDELKRRHQELARLRERALGPVFGKAARALKGSDEASASIRELPRATSPKLALT